MHWVAVTDDVVEQRLIKALQDIEPVTQDTKATADAD
jgi:hypothetical protein